MLKRLPIAPAQVKAGNTSENLLNEIRQVIFSLYWEKLITIKVYTLVPLIFAHHYFSCSMNARKLIAREIGHFPRIWVREN